MAEYEEVTLADLVSTIWRRKVVLGVVFSLCVVGAVSVTAFSQRQYEAHATLIPLQDPDIIANYLDSRQAAAWVGEQIGDRLLQELFPSDWTGTGWRSGAPGSDDIGSAVSRIVNVRSEQTSERDNAERKITITVEFTDPALSRDVANGFLAALENLRPLLENKTRQELFGQFYNGDNEQQARSRAEVEARERDYWLVLDNARTPVAPSSPNVTLNIALGVVLGFMLGIFSVFIVEWASKYRAERRAVVTPDQRFRDPGSP